MTKLRNWALTKATEIRSRDEKGQGLAEYGLILALVSLVAVGALFILGGDIEAVFTEVSGMF